MTRRAKRREAKRRRELILTTLWWVALAVFVVSAVTLGVYEVRSVREKKAHETLAAPVQQAIATGDETVVEDVKEELVAENDDMIGWLSIEGTSLSYPVMHTPASPEYYLRRDFEKNYALSGTPFLDAQCPVDGTGANSIIYGHNMKNNTMFSLLANYASETYYKQHPVIRYETLGDVGSYMVFAVLAVDVDTAADPNALFAYQTLQGADEAAFNAYIAYLMEHSYYSTGATPVYGDTLLTLSTCDNITESGRILVCAKRVS